MTDKTGEFAGDDTIANDRAAIDYAYRGATRLIVIDPAGAQVRTHWEQFFAPHDVQLIDVVTAQTASDRIDQTIGLNGVWAELGTEPAAPELLARLQMLTRRGSLQLVWVARDEALEQGFAALDNRSVQFLCAPTSVDRLTTATLLTTRRDPVLHDINGEPDSVQIQKLTEEVNRIAKLLADLSGVEKDKGFGRFPGPPSGEVRAPAHAYAAQPSYHETAPGRIGSALVSETDIRNVIRMRRLRDEFFPSDIFADPAWDMLLDLLAARLSGDPVSVSSLCIAAAVPATTALRWIRTMTEVGMFVRHSDPQDGRRIFIGLSDQAYDGLMRYFTIVKAQSGMIG